MLVAGGCKIFHAIPRHSKIPLPKEVTWCDYKVVDVKQGSFTILVNGQPKEIRVKGGVYMSDESADSLYLSIRDQALYCDQLKRAVEIHNKEFK